MPEGGGAPVTSKGVGNPEQTVMSGIGVKLIELRTSVVDDVTGVQPAGVGDNVAV